MRPGADTSWMWVKGNLKRIMISIRSFYKKQLGKSLDKDQQPDLER